MMTKQHFISDIKQKFRNDSGFSYLEMMMVVFILALSTGVITDTLSLGVKHLQERTKRSQAIILYETLCSVVRNDLTYATYYNDGAFTTTTKEIQYVLFSQYGTGTWNAQNALENDNTALQNAAQSFDLANPSTYWTACNIPSNSDNPEDDIGWKPFNAGERGQIIRRSLIYNPETKSASFYYTPLTSSQDYSGHGLGGITSNKPLYATIKIDPNLTSGEKSFDVTISIYDSLATLSTPIEGNSQFTVKAIGTW